MRNKPYRKGDRLIESLASGVVVFDLNKFIVSFCYTISLRIRASSWRSHSPHNGKQQIRRKGLINLRVFALCRRPNCARTGTTGVQKDDDLRPNRWADIRAITFDGEHGRRWEWKRRVRVNDFSKNLRWCVFSQCPKMSCKCHSGHRGY